MIYLMVVNIFVDVGRPKLVGWPFTFMVNVKLVAKVIKFQRVISKEAIWMAENVIIWLTSL